MALLQIQDYTLCSTDNYQNEPCRYRWHNGTLELIVWLTVGGWRFFVRKLDYMNDLDSWEKKQMQKLQRIGYLAINKLNKNEKRRITDSDFLR